MPNLDANGLAQLARRLGLVADDQLHECWDEVEPGASAEDLLKVLVRKGYVSAWQSKKLISGDLDGYFLGGYRLLYRIAAGTFGRVYRADNPSTGEVVAIKVLRRRWTEDPHKVELFEREGKVGLTLRHPNIVQILSVSRDPSTGQHYIVMEFVEGGNLRDYLKSRKKFGLDEALGILEESAAGLAYAFTRGLTHRDIKPTNILLSAQGAAKLVDFGLAEITGPVVGGEGEDETEVDRTVDYAGLERATGVKAGDVRSDIYFLGCVFYEMLTGRPLLPVARDRHARMQKPRFEIAGKVSRSDPDLPPAAYALLMRMVAFEPSDRFQTPAQLVEAVRAARRELSGEQPHDSKPVGPPTVFVVEHVPRLQDVFRDKLKRLGYRVLISIDANRALQRYQQQPFHAIVVDARTAGEDAVDSFRRVLSEAELQRLTCAGILLLKPEQKHWASRLDKGPHAAILVEPIMMKQITSKLRELLPEQDGQDEDEDEGA